jgi:membrane-associated phospholipid phosphatase
MFRIIGVEGALVAASLVVAMAMCRMKGLHFSWILKDCFVHVSTVFNNLSFMWVCLVALGLHMYRLSKTRDLKQQLTWTQLSGMIRESFLAISNVALMGRCILIFLLLTVAISHIKPMVPLFNTAQYDKSLRTFDLLLFGGFDFYAWFAGYRPSWLTSIMSFSYTSLFYMILITASVLFAQRHRYGLRLFLTSIVVAQLIGQVLYYALPSLGDIFIFKDLYENIPETQLAKTIMIFLEEQRGILVNHPDQWQATPWQGIAAFPSLHVAQSVLLIYFARRYVRWLLIAYIPLNIMLTFSTVWLGIHYVADVIAGGLLGLLAIGIARRLLVGSELLLRRGRLTFPAARQIDAPEPTGMQLGHPWNWINGAMLAVALLVLALLCATKSYSLDEFQYLHSAWEIAKGQVPYRDFFECHHPLVYQVLSPVFLLGGDHPGTARLMRLGMMIFASIICIAAWRINTGHGRLAPGGTALSIALFVPLSIFLVEIRPDTAAFALFIASLAVLRSRWLGDRAAAVIAGALAALAIWGSQKAGFHELALLGGLIVDLFFRRTRARCLRSPLWFIVGFAAGLLPPAAYLTVTGSWNGWWQHTVVWAIDHQSQYPGFHWSKYLMPIAVIWWWMPGLAGLGILATFVRNRGKWLTCREARNDILVLLALGTTFISCVIQKGAYPYSFVPFFVIGVIFVVRAMGAVTWLLPTSFSRPKLRLILSAAAAGGLAIMAAFALAELSSPLFSNEHQHATFDRIQELTAPGDAAYDNSGSYVSRPHSFWYFHTDALMRRQMDRILSEEVPKELARNKCVMHFIDSRHDDLPQPLRDYLSANYQPYDGDIHLYGRQFLSDATSTAPLAFRAIRDDEYFFAPAEGFVQGQLRIDGKVVEKPIFTLDEGEHTVEYTGSRSVFWILWLPANGKPYMPRYDLKPTFSRLF